MAVFPSIRIEGGLLGPDMLDQLFTGNLSGQKPADFGLADRRNLTDEIAATFADARSLWGVFQNRLSRLKEDDLATTVTRDAWAIPFLGLLGFEPKLNQRAHDVDGLSFFISHRSGEQEDGPPIHIVGARQELGRVAASGKPRLAPHSLVQEYLNRTEHVWGLVTNGTTLRLLRDSSFVRRQSYIEFDLAAMLEEQRFHDFAALYRLIHRSRFPRGLSDAGDCLLETYHLQAEEQGGRVRDHLRDGVEQCITLLANGFLDHPTSAPLRERMASRLMSSEDFYRELLKLVYRFLFLLVAEDRGLLSPAPIYREHYGVSRLRRLLEQRAAYTEDDDLWQGLRVLWHLFGDDKLASILQLAPLNGELFAPTTLDGGSITNRQLLTAFWHLAWYQERESAPATRVNYAALDVEELGSIYESLLDFHPHCAPDLAGRWTFQLVFGSDRKTTGSFYTPPELVNELVRSALDPVVDARLAALPKNAPAETRAETLLSLRVCDPACGSGHFLLAAARRLGRELARARTGEDEPAPERMREATREVIRRCIYGVDRNPLAVDLCRVALWIESHDADKPLAFLDHRIRCGDSLIGVFDLEVLKDGIPQEAFTALSSSDDKKFAREAAKQNKEEKGGMVSLFQWSPDAALSKLTLDGHAVDELDDDTPEHVRQKKARYESIHHDPEWQRLHAACDLWTAAFFQRLHPDEPLITTASVAERLADRSPGAQLLARAQVLSLRQRFFHWPLEFPEVFDAGGFHVILSNPPWEHVELKEQEFFASRDLRIASAPNKSVRTNMIAELKEGNAALHEEFLDAVRAFDAQRQFLGGSSRYPKCGRGRINTYAVFAELAATLTHEAGRTGMILPTGIATDDTTKVFFGDLVRKQRLVSLTGYENESFIFPAVHHAFKFCTLIVAGEGKGPASSRLAFFIRRFSELAEEARFFTLTPDEFALLNPNTGNCPIFRSAADAELTKAIYRRVPVLWREGGEGTPASNPWQLSFKQGLFNMASDSHHFRTADQLSAEGYRLEGNVFVSPYDRYLPLYEAKMLHQFDHRFSTYEGATEAQLRVKTLPRCTPAQKADPRFTAQPTYWVREEIVESAVPHYPEAIHMALTFGSKTSLQRFLCYWCAGWFINRDEKKKAQELLDLAMPFDLDDKLNSYLRGITAPQHAAEMEARFPLTAEDVIAIRDNLKEPEDIARELVERFSPKWFFGWRDVTNVTNQRTLIVSAAPKTAVGHKLLLAFTLHKPGTRLGLIGSWNSFVCDFVARQKVGGMAFTYAIIRQLAVPPPTMLQSRCIGTEPFEKFIFSRVLELVYTSQDLTALARDCGYEGPPFVWDEERRFEIRCELDAAFLHLYLPSTDTGHWQPAPGETAAALTALQSAFATPRHAAEHILNTFPLIREADEKLHGHYRTRDRILTLYDAMLAAQRTFTAFQSSLSPLPGQLN
ncbi:MAG: N-6 DNA methylase [Verrucomicrobiaceae bacterium]|nr:N-6 DNA methylase [Verrucomicrobiaceae bacterium]